MFTAVKYYTVLTRFISPSCLPQPWSESLRRRNSKRVIRYHFFWRFNVSLCSFPDYKKNGKLERCQSQHDMELEVQE